MGCTKHALHYTAQRLAPSRSCVCAKHANSCGSWERVLHAMGSLDMSMESAKKAAYAKRQEGCCRSCLRTLVKGFNAVVLIVGLALLGYGGEWCSALSGSLSPCRLPPFRLRALRSLPGHCQQAGGHLVRCASPRAVGGPRRPMLSPGSLDLRRCRAHCGAGGHPVSPPHHLVWCVCHSAHTPFSIDSPPPSRPAQVPAGGAGCSAACFSWAS